MITCPQRRIFPFPVISIGTDIIDIARVASKRDAVMRRVLLPAEHDYCLDRGTPDQAVAGHFAAKEAAFKALRVNEDGGMSWHDIEITHKSGGAPRVLLHGTAKHLAESHGMKSIEISISHVKEFAVATAVCEWKD